MKLPQISPSSLGIINPDLGEECPRCFWHDRWDKKKHKDDRPEACKRPEGIFPSLPNGIDRVLKKVSDRHAGSLPPFLQNKTEIEGYALYSDRESLAVWMNAFKGLEATAHGITLKGAVDEIMVREVDGLHTPTDWKTRGFPPKPDAPNYYGLQLDCYGFLQERKGLKQTGEGVLVYYWPIDVPDEASENEPYFQFETEIQVKDLDIARVEDLMLTAREILEGAEPDAGEKCKFCAFVERRMVDEAVS